MDTPQRNYNVADATMLIASATITESAITNKAFLQSKRSVWKDPFFDDLKNDIDNTIKEYLGVDGAKALREATQLVMQNATIAKTILAEVKVQIEVDFDEDITKRDEILKQLGFTDYYKSAAKGNQENMIQLLTRFKTNMDGELEKELINNGIMPESLKILIVLSDKLKDAEVTQEGEKGIRVNITEEGINAFNEIHKRTISICKIATKFLKEKPVLKQQFSFTKVTAAQGGKPSKPTPPPTDGTSTNT